ncbi:MAG: CDP-glycerol glycerophosphotransferase family protein [Deltaproteobacteria bacterium]|nr:CDP-glycerol glycerophosphotransferase family protein [Deltaproteobacteria bacterium]
MKFIHSLRILFLLPLHLVYLISGFFSRNPKIWLFGCWEGRAFRGGNKFLFLHVRRNHPEINSIWITKNNKLLRELQAKGIAACHAFSVKGMLAGARAKYIFVTHDVCDVNQYVSRNSIYVDLSHATCPIKKMGYANSYDPYYNPPTWLKKIYFFLINPYGYIRPDYAVTASEHTSAITEQVFQVGGERIVATGLPKTDMLFEESIDKNGGGLDGIVDTGKYDTIILFLPTHRNDPGFNLFHFGFSLEKTEEILTACNALLLFNPHPFDSARMGNSENIDGAENCMLLDCKGDEMNLLLRKADMLITDYSSLWADFLVFDKPILFAQFDHEGYLKEREIFGDYDNDYPGPKVQNWPDLLEEIKNILINGKDEFASHRNDVRRLIYPDADGHASERIVSFVKTLQ